MDSLSSSTQQIDPISEDRLAELKTARALNLSRGKAAYQDCEIRTPSELHWILSELAQRQIDVLPAEKRLDLRGSTFVALSTPGVNLAHADLRSACFIDCDLSRADLRSADLRNTIFRQVNLTSALLDRADLTEADLGGTSLGGALSSPYTCEVNLAGAFLSEAKLQHAKLAGVNFTDARGWLAMLDHADLSGATMTNVNLGRASLSHAMLKCANLHQATLIDTNLGHAVLHEANLRKINLSRSDLTAAYLNNADMAGAGLAGANLSSAILENADLSGANLRGARLDANTVLSGAKVDNATCLGEVRWNGALLTHLPWERVNQLGDEVLVAYADTAEQRAKALQEIGRAYRGVATALRAQSLITPASRFRLRAERLERKALWEHKRVRHLVSWVGSWLLDVFAGYGEQPWKPFCAYAITLVISTAAYGLIAQHDVALSRMPWWEWVFLSVTAFHGRGFFPTTLPSSSPGVLTLVAVVEAIIGLFIEFTFIATFSRRFLGT